MSAPTRATSSASTATSGARSPRGASGARPRGRIRTACADVEPLEPCVTSQPSRTTTRCARRPAAEARTAKRSPAGSCAHLARIAQPLDVESRARRSPRRAAARAAQPPPRELARSVASLLRRRRTPSGPRPRPAVERGPIVAAIVMRRRAQRRDEAAHRLGLPRQDALVPRPARGSRPRSEAPCSTAPTYSRATSYARHARRPSWRTTPRAPSDAIAIAVARDAPEGWPARLSAAWLETTFAPFMRGLRLDRRGSRRPSAAPASPAHARRSGRRSARRTPRLRCPSRSRANPELAAAHRFANVFGALPATRAFQQRVLGNAARVAESGARPRPDGAPPRAARGGALPRSRAPWPSRSRISRIAYSERPCRARSRERGRPRDDDAPARLLGLDHHGRAQKRSDRSLR